MFQLRQITHYKALCFVRNFSNSEISVHVERNKLHLLTNMLANKTCILGKQIWPVVSRICSWNVSARVPTSNFSFESNVRQAAVNTAADAQTDKEINKDSQAENNVEQSKLQEEITSLNESLNEIKEKYQRSLAEAENMRMRLIKEQEETKLYGIQSFCKDLLEVADVMRMAVSSIPQQKLADETDATWKSFYEGVALTEKEMLTVFQKHGLGPLDPNVGDKFDPYDHEALFQTPVADLGPGLVAHVARIGYKLHGRTLRPARVGVTVAAK